MKNIIIFFIIVFSFFVLSACGAPDKTVFEENGFKFHVAPYECYKDISTCDEVNIFELIGENKNQEIVYFPESLMGIDGVVIGTHASNKIFFKNEHAKVVYLNGENTRVENGAFVYFTSLETVVINNILNKTIYRWTLPGLNDYVIPHEVPDSYLTHVNTAVIRRSRVSYYFNYNESPNNGLYIIGIEKENEMITEPKEPEREGYLFSGWYKEEDCTTKFSFDNEDNENLNELQLYAKWEEVNDYILIKDDYFT